MHRLALALFLCTMAVRPVFAGEVYVSAAASLNEALTEAGAAFTKATGHKVVANFASTATLAQQIVAGSPVDVFLSANEKWMDHVAAKRGIEPGTRRDLLKNTLALVAPVDSAVSVSKPEDIGSACAKLAIGEPSSVPAGIYAKQSLEKLGLWGSLSSRTVPAQDVRAALMYVERKEVPCGLVYSTDAMISKNVKTIFTMPESSHDPIVYPIAQVSGAKNAAAAKAFLEFLGGAEAEAIFSRFGFFVMGE